ncbi:MAG: type II toxin-antitoxin system VapC family toxin [Gemmatimonadota bacterium]
MPSATHVIVLDASVLIDVLLRGPDAELLSSRLLEDGDSLHVPHLLDVEVAQVLRRFTGRGSLTSARASASLRLLAQLPLIRHAHTPFLTRVWALRGNLTAYDAAYVALAEVLEATLLTRDRRLGTAAGHLAQIEVV